MEFHGVSLWTDELLTVSNRLDNFVCWCVMFFFAEKIKCPVFWSRYLGTGLTPLLMAWHGISNVKKGKHPGSGLQLNINIALTHKSNWIEWMNEVSSQNFKLLFFIYLIFVNFYNTPEGQCKKWNNLLQLSSSSPSWRKGIRRRKRKGQETLKSFIQRFHFVS